MSRLFSITLLFNFYVEYIMQNAKLDESQAGIKIAGRNVNNLRYSDDATLMAESEEELQRLLMNIKYGVKNSNCEERRLKRQGTKIYLNLRDQKVK